MRAFIDGDGAGGIFADSVTLTANDNSSIQAIAGAASIAAALGSDAGVSISLGISLAFNRVDNRVEAFIANADTGVTTANGSTTVAPIQLSSIRVQHVAVFDIQGAVARPGRLETGLLGMSFLERLAETSFRGDHLILRQTLPSPDTGSTGAPANN